MRITVYGVKDLHGDDDSRLVSMERDAILNIFGPNPWGHSGPLHHALSLSWTSMRRWRATVPLVTSGELA